MSPKKISSEIAYQEIYQEMRRYRDYELSVSTWYTTILLAILGGILTAKYGNNPGLGELTKDCYVKVITAIVIIVIGVSGTWSAYFAYRRYEHIKKYIFDEKLNLEPEWKKKYKPEDIFLKPRQLILATQIILIVLSIVVVFLPT